MQEKYKVAVTFRTTLVYNFHLIAFKGSTAGHKNSGSSCAYRAAITK